MNRERGKQMVALREQGDTYEEIAQRFGLSAERVRQLIVYELQPSHYWGEPLVSVELMRLTMRAVSARLSRR